MPSQSLSKKSEKFKKYIEELTPEKVEQLIELEQGARMVVHIFDLVGEVSVREIHGLARAQKKLMECYEAE